MKRKNKQVQDAKRQEIMSKMPKLDTFFTTSTDRVPDDNNATVSREDMEIRDAILEQTPVVTQIRTQSDTTESAAGDDSSDSEQLGDSQQEREMNDSEEEGADTINSSEVLYDYYDIASWPQPLSKDTRVHIIKKGPIRCLQYTYPSDKNGRHFSEVHYKRKLPNGEYLDRSWLVYSMSNDRVYCFACKLFQNHKFCSRVYWF